MNEIIEFITNKEILNIFLGVFITIFTGTIIFIIQIIIKYIFERRGKLNIYFKHVHSTVSSKPMNRFKEMGTYRVQVPLWIEIHNTQEVKRIVRNFNIVAFYKNKKIDNFLQINDYTKDRIPLANNGFYSFIIAPNEIKNMN